MKALRPLHMGRGVVWPAKIATQATALLGVRGAGKSNLARVFAEECYRSDVPFVVFDPIGNWYGVRAGRDGNPRGGLPVPIFGGEHADLPLERSSGQKIADLVLERKLSCVLDLSHPDLSETDKRRFLIDFGDRLFRRKSREGGWLLLIMEETDDYAPQTTRYSGAGSTAECLGMFQKIVKRGRFKGLGVLMITQRSAAINKDLLYMTGNLIVFRTTGPGDMKAIEGWVKHQALSTDMMASLPQLADGEAWVWSPEFLKELAQVKFRYMDTLDTGATPEHGRGGPPPATLADIDVPALTKELAEAVERAKAQDPRELQAKVAKLERALKEQQAQTVHALHRPEPKPKTVELPIFKDSQVKRLEAIFERMVKEAERHGTAMGLFWKNQDEVARALLDAVRTVALAKAPLPPPSPPSGPAPPTTRRPVLWKAGPAVVPTEPERVRPERLQPGDGLPAMQRAFLTALAESKDRPLSKRQILISTGYASSGPVSKMFAALVREGHASSPFANHLQITASGLGILGNYEQPPKGEALRAWLLQKKCSGMEAALLGAIFDAYPNAIAKSEILRQTRYASSGPVSKAFGKIVVMGWATRAGPNLLRAADELFGSP